MQTLALSDALFTATQQKILGLLYGKPDQSFYANEIARWADVGKGSLMRELDRLHRKTFGIGEALRTALAPLAEQLQQAFVYGSIAKGNAHAGSDIDLMLIGENLAYGDVVERLLPVEERLGRSINPTIYTPADWLAKQAAGNSFVLRVAQQDKINLIGGLPPEAPAHEQ
jgi:predicted nucleotidyltransferase